MRLGLMSALRRFLIEQNQRGNLQFNHFLVKDDEPALFHALLRGAICFVKRERLQSAESHARH